MVRPPRGTPCGQAGRAVTRPLCPPHTPPRRVRRPPVVGRFACCCPPPPAEPRFVSIPNKIGVNQGARLRGHGLDTRGCAPGFPRQI